jgi:hypothetical protein
VCVCVCVSLFYVIDTGSTGSRVRHRVTDWGLPTHPSPLPQTLAMQRPRNSQEFRKGKSRGNLARTPDVAVVISLKLVFGPCG